MAEENQMNKGPAVSPQGEVMGEKKQTATKWNRFVGLRREPSNQHFETNENCETGCRCERSNLGRGQRGRPDFKTKY